jgi:hypothetical protein
VRLDGALIRHDGAVTSDPERRLTTAQERLKHLGGSDSQTWQDAFDELHAAERSLAASRREQYAVPVDDGPLWDVGAPLPHLIANGWSVHIVCHANQRDPAWDGTYVTMVSPGDSAPSPLLLLEATGCAEIRMGGPNDEALGGHPLSGKGLVGYRLNEVHNSEWIERAIQVNSVHPSHRDEPFRQLRHFVLPFHDEMVEVLARSIETTLVHGTLRGVLTGLAERLTT